METQKGFKLMSNLDDLDLLQPAGLLWFFCGDLSRPALLIDKEYTTVSEYNERYACKLLEDGGWEDRHGDVVYYYIKLEEG